MCLSHQTDEKIAKKSGLLYFSAKEGYTSVVETLMEAGTDVNKEEMYIYLLIANFDSF